MQYRYLAPKYTSSVKNAPLSGSDALVQLWAADYVDQWLKTGLGDRFEECANLSASYHVVTPVSSAVVAQPEEAPQSAVADSPDYDFNLSSDLSFGLTAPPDTRVPRMSFAGGFHRHEATIYDDEPIITDGRSAGDELPGNSLRAVYAPVSKADGPIAREPSSNLVSSKPVIVSLFGIATLLLAGLLFWARRFIRERRGADQESPNRDAVP